jgi:SPP1 gp7 family putative phage head morphogenesis protein
MVKNTLKEKLLKKQRLTQQVYKEIYDGFYGDEMKIKRLSSRSKSVEDVAGLILAFVTTKYLANMDYDKIESLFTKAVGIGNTDTIDGIDVSKLTAKDLEDVQSQIVAEAVDYVKSLEDDSKTALAAILEQGIKDELTVGELKEQIAKEFDIADWRAAVIARTEVSRINSTISWEAATASGAKYYMVNNSLESCEECAASYEGYVFDIEDDENLPPLHPNCLCEPIYFDDYDEAREYTDDVQSGNMHGRDVLEDKGYTIAPDGTGAVKEDKNKE